MKPLQTIHRHTRRGVTFIELIGVLVVAIIIIAGALALYSEANTSSRTNQLIVALGALSGSVRALHANTATYGGTVATGAANFTPLEGVLVAANAVPPGMLVQDLVAGTASAAASAKILHAFGGRVGVVGKGPMFTIGILGLDEDVCIRIATESTAKASSGLRGVYINTTAAATALVGATSAVVGLAVGDAAAGLITAATSGSGTVAVAAGTVSNFVYSQTTGSVGVASATIPIAPAAAEAACASTDENMIGWVFQ